MDLLKAVSCAVDFERFYCTTSSVLHVLYAGLCSTFTEHYWLCAVCIGYTIYIVFTTGSTLCIVYYINYCPCTVCALVIYCECTWPVRPLNSHIIFIQVMRCQLRTMCSSALQMPTTIIKPTWTVPSCSKVVGGIQIAAMAFWTRRPGAQGCSGKPKAGNPCIQPSPPWW